MSYFKFKQISYIIYYLMTAHVAAEAKSSATSSERSDQQSSLIWRYTQQADDEVYFGDTVIKTLRMRLQRYIYTLTGDQSRQVVLNASNLVTSYLSFGDQI